jgi:hypothetical protein
MTRARKMLVAVLLALAVAVYVAARIDFLRNFNSEHLAAYVGNRWPYWVAMLLIVGALSLSVVRK